MDELVQQCLLTIKNRIISEIEIDVRTNKSKDVIDTKEEFLKMIEQQIKQYKKLFY